MSADDGFMVELGEGAIQVLELDEDEIAVKYPVTVTPAKRPKMWRVTGSRAAMEKLVEDFSERTNRETHAWDWPESYFRSAKVAASKIRLILEGTHV